MLTAIDPQRRPRDEIGVVRHQGHNVAGDVQGMAQSADWDFGDDFLSVGSSQHILLHGGLESFG
jgi:hypothetical protein